MRRRLLLLTAGLPAYYLGATLNLYLRQPAACACSDAACRIMLREVSEQMRAALSEPFKPLARLAAPRCS